jgi:hypothetical protein
MNTDAIVTILATIVTVLGSTSAWRYFEKRAMFKERTENFMKDDCRERIIKLEALLQKSSEEKDDMRRTILSLSSQVAELKVKVEFLEQENHELNRQRRKRFNNE